MRRRYARLLTLVLIAGLALLCCACAQVACHRCDHGPRCPICECVRLAQRGALLPALLLAAFGALALRDRARLARRAPDGAPTLFDMRVRLND